MNTLHLLEKKSCKNRVTFGLHLDTVKIINQIHTHSILKVTEKKYFHKEYVHVAIICKNKLLRLFVSFITLIMRGSSAGSRGKQL